MQALFNAIQEACTKTTWSRAVELVRADAVTSEGPVGEGLAFRVAVRGGLASYQPVLYLEDEDWECTCPGQDDACEHVAAAAIALRRARRSGSDVPAAGKKAGRIRYRFVIKGNELALVREVVSEGGDERLNTSIDAIAKGRRSGPALVATPLDTGVERLLGPRKGGPLPRNTLHRVLEALADAGDTPVDVRLGEAPIQVSREPVVPIGRVVDAPGGVRLYVEQDPGIEQVFRNGAALCRGQLRPIGESGLDGREREELPRGRFYPSERFPELVTDVLPDLERRIPIEVATAKLPRTSAGERPRVRIEVHRDGDGLSLLPTLVYGDPPQARVDSGQLVHLRGDLPLRDPAAENAEAARLRERLGLAIGHRRRVSDHEAIAMADRLERWPGEVVGGDHRAFYQAPPLAPLLEIEGDRLRVAFESRGAEDIGGDGDAAAANVGAGSASADAVIRAWREGASLVALDGGGFAPLPSDWLTRFGDRVADLLAARAAGDRIPAYALPDLGRLCADLDTPPPPDLDRLRPIIDGFEGIPSAPLPEDLRAELRPYQKQGVDWLCFMRDVELGALLADDMGLGKTLQALCAIESPTLVVAPTSVLPNWVDEIERFRPGLSICLYHGGQRELDEDADVTLTSYAILRLDAEKLRAREWATIVLDEAQNVKNPRSQVARAAHGMRARFRLALTGTPVENRLEELWSQFHFLNPGLLGGRPDFQDRYARPIADGDAEVAARLRERIRPFLMRRLKRDVAPELPPRTDIVLHCKLDEDERAVYDAVRAATVSRVVEQLRGGGGGVMAALEALLRLRQAACHPSLVPGQEATRSSKLDLLRDRLETAVAEGHKALVFSQWTGLLDLVEPEMHDAGLNFVRLDGSTRDRRAVVEAFQSKDGPPVMLVSLKAGGSGLNLTAADHIFLLDPWWNPAVEDQAADRAHRIGQTRNVMVHRLVSENTVEERILELHERKRALFEATVGAAGDGEGLSREDLIALLGD
jgi:superfamily II DNA or RNA helicase